MLFMVMILVNNLAKLEIMIKGAELSSKLNSIGVINDFGKKSEGKQDLTEIIDLVIITLDDASDVLYPLEDL